MMYNCNCLDEQNIRALCLLNAKNSAIKYCGQSALHDRMNVLTVRLSNGRNHGGLFDMVKKKNVGIYKIENVVNGNSYIGQSINLYMREHQHFSNLKNNRRANQHFQNAYNKYGKKNFVFIPLLYCEDFELTRYEQELVDRINPKYNICRECVDSNKGIKLSEEHRKKTSLALIGNTRSKGIKRTEEAIRKTALANTGKKRSEETKQKISKSLTGKKLSEEHKRKLAESHIGRKASEETKQKMSLAHTGIKMSDEARRNNSLAQKARFEHGEQYKNRGGAE